jgi:hypothetical protein
VRDDGDARRRHDDEADSEHADRADAHSQISQRGEERGPVEQRRQHAEEDQLGAELDRRHAGHEPDRQPAEHEQDWIRNAQGGRDGEHRRHGDEQHDDDDAVLDLQMHGSIVPNETF